MKFVPISYPYRFRSIDDARKHQETNDPTLTIPPFIEHDTPQGKKVTLNPEYRDAPYEYRIVVLK